MHSGKSNSVGDRDIIGRSITLDSAALHRGRRNAARFVFPVGNTKVKFWTTLARDATADTATPMTEQRGARMLNVIARLEDRAFLWKRLTPRWTLSRQRWQSSIRTTTRTSPARMSARELDD